MSYSIFLDDTRDAPTKLGKLPWGFVTVRSYEQFVAAVTKYGCPEFITFDHDLGEEKTGMDCAKWFIEWILDDRSRLAENFNFAVHSRNPAGAANITGLMSGFLSCMASEQYGIIRQLLIS